MNRYNRPGFVGGASSTNRASATTVCQKCLKKGRRMLCARSQQFLNPKLKPKLANIAPTPTPTEQERHGRPQTFAQALTLRRILLFSFRLIHLYALSFSRKTKKQTRCKARKRTFGYGRCWRQANAPFKRCFITRPHAIVRNLKSQHPHAQKLKKSF
ncbi:hypothetical protein E4T45_13209 [Aureobasidium sp. EXF-8846]|nr:hypothetical protein E4T45_13209 [Aureobasidium sp. EXF-8846]